MSSNTYPYYEYVKEDKSKYKHAKDCGFVDPDDDWLIGESGGFLPNITFTFVDTHLFREKAIFFTKYKCYTFEPKDTINERNIRLEEIRKRKYGVTFNCKLKNGKKLPLRITGEHYNFLNYGRMYRSAEKIDNFGRKVIKKETGFPSFFSAQYWWFKAREFAKNNEFNLIGDKSRRAGFSYMQAITGANTINLIKESTIILAAADKKYLIQGTNPTTRMLLKQLEFYDKHTFFKKGLISRDIENIILGYKNKAGGNEGQQSSAITVSFANDPNAAVGKDAVEVDIDELTNSPGLRPFLDMTEATTRTGTYKTGMIVGFGTGGGKKKTQEEFELLFYKPASYSFMPFENIWDDDARDSTCGYFKPYIDSLEGEIDGVNIIDIDGNTNYELAIRFCENERANKKANSTPDIYIQHCSQYANKPSESFSSATDNMFASPELNEHIDRVKTDKDFKIYTDGMVVKENGKYIFKSNLKLESEGIKIHPYIERVPFDTSSDFYGCIRQYYPPSTINGVIPDNLYRIWYDPFGVNKEKNDVTNKHSLGAIYVFARKNNLGVLGYGGKLVAVYVGRPNTMAEVDKIALYLCKLYNAKMLVENNKGETIQNFRLWNELNCLVKEPTLAWDTSVNTKTSNEYGISVGDTNTKLLGLSLLYDFLYNKEGFDSENHIIYTFHKIIDLPTLLELQKFKFNGNFDRISALIVGMFDLKELLISNLTIKANMNNNPNKVKTLFSRPFFANK